MSDRLHSFELVTIGGRPTVVVRWIGMPWLQIVAEFNDRKLAESYVSFANIASEHEVHPAVPPQRDVPRIDPAETLRLFVRAEVTDLLEEAEPVGGFFRDRDAEEVADVELRAAASSAEVLRPHVSVTQEAPVERSWVVGQSVDVWVMWAEPIVSAIEPEPEPEPKAAELATEARDVVAAEPPEPVPPLADLIDDDEAIEPEPEPAPAPAKVAHRPRSVPPPATPRSNVGEGSAGQKLADLIAADLPNLMSRFPRGALHGEIAQFYEVPEARVRDAMQRLYRAKKIRYESRPGMPGQYIVAADHELPSDPLSTPERKILSVLADRSRSHERRLVQLTRLELVRRSGMSGTSVEEAVQRLLKLNRIAIEDPGAPGIAPIYRVINET